MEWRRLRPPGSGFEDLGLRTISKAKLRVECKAGQNLRESLQGKEVKG